MVNKISFENRTGQAIQVVVEPEAVNIELESGQAIEIELILKTDKYDDKFACIMEEGRMIIYECRQYEMKIFLDEQLEYYTPPGRYW